MPVATAAHLLEASLPLVLFEAMIAQRDAGLERAAGELALVRARRLVAEAEEFLARTC